MQSFPHHYRVKAAGGPDGAVNLDSEGVARIETMPPPEFGGPGGHWSPESLLVASVADCFVMSFRAIAKASSFEWLSLKCEAEGTLEAPDRVAQFTGFRIRAKLELAEGARAELAEKLLHKAEHTCLVTNSMTAEVTLETEVVIA